MPFLRLNSRAEERGKGWEENEGWIDCLIVCLLPTSWLAIAELQVDIGAQDGVCSRSWAGGGA